MKRLAVIGAALAMLTLRVHAQDPERQLKAAINLEMIDGDLKGAIEQYKKIGDGKDRALAAKALLRLGEAYQKLGDAEAKKIYERIVRDFGAQPEAAEASAALRALGGDAPAGISEPRLVSPKLHVQGLYFGGSISSDGKTAAVNLNDEDIAIQDLATGRIVKQLGLHGDPNDDLENVVLSPDGSEIAYNLRHGSDPNQLRVVTTSVGAKPRVLISNGEVEYPAPMAWSSDDKRVLTALQRKDLTWRIAWVSTADGAITVLKSLNWRFDEGMGMSLSPDSRYIVYAATSSNPPKFPPSAKERAETRIYVLPSDGNGPEEEVVRTTGVNTSPIWSADGMHVLFVSDRNGGFGIWTVPVAQGKATDSASLLKKVGGPMQPIAVTRDGTYYYSTKSTNETVAIVSAADGAVIDRIAGRNPSWSPDGKSIALLRRNSSLANSVDLIVHSLQSGDEKRFVREGVFGPVLWLRDGGTVLVNVSAAPNRASVGRVNLATGDFTEILPAGDESRGRGTLSADNRTLYFPAQWGPPNAATKHAIVAADLATGQEHDVVLTKGPVVSSIAGGLFLRPDGKTIAFFWWDYPTQQVHVMTVDVDGTHEREVMTRPASQPFAFALMGWSADGRSIKFIDQDGRINQVPATGGQPEYTGSNVPVKKYDFGVAVRLSPAGDRYAIGTSGAVLQVWAIDHLAAPLKAPK